MVGSIWLEGIVSQKSQADERDAMETATTVATEAVVSIRTVQSLGKIVIKVKTLDWYSRLKHLSSLVTT